jgi:DNA ligase-1
MKLNKLYARTNTGAIQQWEIEIEANWYRTTYGQVDGQLVTTLPTYCNGKNPGKSNETNGEEQALKEAQAIFKKKLKEGYKEDITKIDEETFFQCQLAKQFEDYKDKVEYPLAVEDKLNGIKCIFSKKGAFSRTGEEFFCLDHIKEELAPLFEKSPSLILDGELFNPELKNELNKIASLVSVNRKEKDVTEDDKQRAKDIIKYYIYDGFGFSVEYSDGKGFPVEQKTPFKQRKLGLRNLINSYNYSILHDYVLVNSYEEILGMMEVVKEEKGEGLMIKVLDAYYENKRSKNMLKLKVFYDEEFEVLGFVEGEGNWVGKVKKVICKLNEPATNGKVDFESNIRGTMEELAELWNNYQQHIGKKVTVEFQEYSPYKIPLIPYCSALFRDYE